MQECSISFGLDLFSFQCASAALILGFIENAFRVVLFTPLTRRTTGTLMILDALADVLLFGPLQDRRGRAGL